MVRGQQSLAIRREHTIYRSRLENYMSQATLSAAETAKILRRLKRIAWLTDTAWRIPFTNIRFGLDPLVGLIPGVGDGVMLLVSVYTMMLAHKAGAPGNLLLRMAANVAVDFGAGSIPVVGDIFDMFFKSNVRNLNLLTEFLEKKGVHIDL
jgi:Domain of unknown function (DUF4112)